MKSIVRFAFKLLAILAGIFLIQILILYKLSHPLFDNYIVQAYLLNYFLALSIYILIFKLKEIIKNQIGFIFIGGSFLKFLLFFIFFYPQYKADSVISKFEFAAFFIPYLICLVIETLAIIEILKALDYKNPEAQKTLKK